MESGDKTGDGENGQEPTRSGEKRPENGDGITKAERAARDAKGRFAQGNQAAVGHGRPKKDFDIETAARDWTPEILEHFAYQGTIAETGAQVEMGKAVLAYGHGKPRTRLEHSGPGGGPIQIAAARTTEQKRARVREIARAAAVRVTATDPPALPAPAEDESPAAPDPEGPPPDGAGGE